MSRVRGIRPKSTDVPALSVTRDALRSLIGRVDRWRRPERNAAMQLAYGLVRDQLAQEVRSVEELIAYAQRERQVATGCRGGAPAVKGHGCPALAPAVGPAPMVSESCATVFPADPLLLGLPMQELLVGGPSLPVDIICAKEANL